MTSSTPDNGNEKRTSLFNRSPKSESKTEGTASLVAIKDSLLSTSEYNFFSQACEVLSDQYVVCPRVSAAEVLAVNGRDNKETQAAASRIFGRQFDLVICEAETMKVLFVVMFTDSSRGTDNSLQQACKIAGLPVLQVECQHEYSPQEMIEMLFSPLRPKSEATSTRSNQVQPSRGPVKLPPPLPENRTTSSEPVTCPKCGAPMKKRVASSGAHQGQVYSVCSNYPKCPTFYPTGEKESK
jgi:hypothetical protein